MEQLLEQSTNVNYITTVTTNSSSRQDNWITMGVQTNYTDGCKKIEDKPTAKTEWNTDDSEKPFHCFFICFWGKIIILWNRYCTS